MPVINRDSSISIPGGEVSLPYSWLLLLAKGSTRTVYVASDREVVKIESVGTFNNVLEYTLWQDLQYCPEVADWLAPCIGISPDGSMLMQRRAEPLPEDYKLPEYLPEFLTDTRRDNYGLLDGRFVCVDYAGLIRHACTALRKVEWK